MTFFRSAPDYTEPLTTGDNTTASWYRWFQNIDKGLPPSSELAVTITASPWTYTAPSRGFVLVTGGTVSLIQFSRTTGTFYPIGQTSGIFPVSQNDQLKVTYSAAPIVTFVPQ